MEFDTTRPANRPIGTVFAPEFFQVAYVTTDIDQAVEVLGQRYGIQKFGPLDTPLPNGGIMKIRLAWLGPMMIEIIDATKAGMEMYSSVLPEDGFAIRHHHLGYFIKDDAQWDALHKTLKAQDMPVVFGGVAPGDMLRFSYIKAPEMGHYLEYVQLYGPGKELFDSVPRN